MASVICKFDQQARSGRELCVFEGSEGFRRDFLFVDDAVDVNLFFLDHPGTSGIFNCGTGRARSFSDLARAVARHYPGTEVVEVPFPDDLAGKYQAYTQADLTRLRAAGYAAEFTDLEAGVAAYVAVLKDSGGTYRAGARP
jgi:ADP-L-glycero-D-manno-heptose 6-epimerase